jgi:hypothetical protein
MHYARCRSAAFDFYFCRQKESMSTSKVILSILGAAVVGYVVADYLTSESGKSLVEKVKNSAGDWLGTLKQEGERFARGTTSEQAAEFDQANATPGQA